MNGPALRFGWVAAGVTMPYEVVVLGVGQEEVLRSGPLTAAEWTPTAAEAQVLAPGETYQWCVLGGGEGLACSTLQSFQMR